MERGIILQAGLIGLGLSVDDHDYRDVILGAAGISANLVGLKYSRAAELEADRYGVRYMADAGYNPEAAVTLQQTFVRLADGREPGWLEGMFASHPPSQERVEANRRNVVALPTRGGELNAEPYREAVASLREADPAYDAMAAGYQALERGQTEQALRLAQQAIAILPREAKFYALAAEAHARAGNHQQAVSLLDQALDYNPQYFGYYLQRGLAQKALGRAQAAQQDLAASNRLLPTAQAHTTLGLMSLDAGDPASALEHFRVGAEADSSAGIEARRMLTRLELPSRPERYIQITIHRDDSGYLFLRAVNHSPLPVAAVQVAVAVHNPDGSVASRTTITVPDVIPPGQTASAPTRIGRFLSDDHLAASVRVAIRSARIAE
jgi:tetratricopeptide (TPR) repeat protein